MNEYLSTGGRDWVECRIGAVPSVGGIGRLGITGIGKLLENPSCPTHSSSMYDGNWMSNSLVSSAYCLLSWSTCLRKINPSSVPIWYHTGPVTLTILPVTYFGLWKFLACTFSPTSNCLGALPGILFSCFSFIRTAVSGWSESSTSSPSKVGL